MADGLLVVFLLTGVYTLFMMLGLLCDCCCPEAPRKAAAVEAVGRNGIPNGNAARQEQEPGRGQGQKKAKGKGGRNRREH